MKKMSIRVVLATLCAALGATALLAVGAPAYSAGPTVGVLPNASGVCPAGLPRYWVYMDNEDSSNNNNRYGWIGGAVSTANTRFYLCAVDGDRFLGLLAYKVNFAVLALGPTCPAGTYTVDRFVDDEDSGNTSGSSVPSGSGTGTTGGGNSRFRFCHFLNYASNAVVPPNSAFPDLGGIYGVFGPAAAPAIETGWVYTDDEDSDNSNSVTGTTDPTVVSYRSQWLGVGGNTTFRIQRVR